MLKFVARFVSIFSVVLISLPNVAVGGPNSGRVRLEQVHLVHYGSNNVVTFRGLSPNGTKINFVMQDNRSGSRDFLNNCYKAGLLVQSDSGLALEAKVNQGITLNTETTDGRGYHVAKVVLSGAQSQTPQVTCITASKDTGKYNHKNNIELSTGKPFEYLEK